MNMNVLMFSVFALFPHLTAVATLLLWCHHVLPLQRLSNFSSRIQIVWSGSLGSLCFHSFRWGGCRRWWLWGPGELVPPESCDLVSCWRRVQYFSFTYWTIKMAISASCINVDIVQLSFLGWYGRQRSLCHKGGLSSIAILRASFWSQRWAETSCSFFNQLYWYWYVWVLLSKSCRSVAKMLAVCV